MDTSLNFFKLNAEQLDKIGQIADLYLQDIKNDKWVTLDPYVNVCSLLLTFLPRSSRNNDVDDLLINIETKIKNGEFFDSESHGIKHTFLVGKLKEERRTWHPHLSAAILQWIFLVQRRNTNLAECK